MEFFIKKNATLPLLKMQVVQDGRSGYQQLMETLECSTIYFTMIDVETGIPKIVSGECGITSLFLPEGAPTEYYVYFRFTERDTNTPGRYQGQFLIQSDKPCANQSVEIGTLILPIREALYINVQDSFISKSPCC